MLIKLMSVCYIKRKKINERTRILISFKREALMADEKTKIPLGCKSGK